MPNGTHYQCSGCGQRFLGLTAFDTHRTGNHARRERRCMVRRDMSKHGLQRNERGEWFLPVQEQFPSCNVSVHKKGPTCSRMPDLSESLVAPSFK